MTEKDFYAILGIDEHTVQAEIRVAYRKLALQYHPDRNKDNPTATARMKDLNEAYAILSDPIKRQEYDQLRQQEGQSASEHYKQTHTAEDIFKGSDINQIYGDLAKQFGLRNFDKVFREAYGPRYRSFEFLDKGMRGRAFVVYDSPKDKTKRGEKGSQQSDTDLAKILQQMAVDSKIIQKGKDLKNRITVSSVVANQGGEVELRFNQQGLVKKLKIKIPAGIKEGQQIKLRGLGGPGKGGGPSGDLYLKVSFGDSPWNRFFNLFKS
jgi:DnaJ-class molecular chaperone